MHPLMEARQEDMWLTAIYACFHYFFCYSNIDKPSDINFFINYLYYNYYCYRNEGMVLEPPKKSKIVL